MKLLKECRCGAKRTDGKPEYCEECRTFTHPAYVQNRKEVRSGREKLGA